MYKIINCPVCVNMMVNDRLHTQAEWQTMTDHTLEPVTDEETTVLRLAGWTVFRERGVKDD